MCVPPLLPERGEPGVLIPRRPPFDLAAREFQIYINNYPRGRFIDTARKWKGMSTQEMLYRLKKMDHQGYWSVAGKQSG